MLRLVYVFKSAQTCYSLSLIWYNLVAETKQQKGKPTRTKETEVACVIEGFFLMACV